MSYLIDIQMAVDGLWSLDVELRPSAIDAILDMLKGLPPAQPEIIRCKDCKFYSPMNRETKTGICNLTMHQNFGDDWFCAGAERRTNERSNR